MAGSNCAGVQAVVGAQTNQREAGLWITQLARQRAFAGQTARRIGLRRVELLPTVHPFTNRQALAAE